MRRPSTEPHFTNKPPGCTVAPRSFPDLRRRPIPSSFSEPDPVPVRTDTSSPTEPDPDRTNTSSPPEPRDGQTNQSRSTPPFSNVLREQISSVRSPTIWQRLCSITTVSFLYLQKYHLASLLLISVYLFFLAFICCSIFSSTLIVGKRKPKVDSGILSQNSVVNWTYFHAFTITTIGYGDITPEEPIHKIACCFMIFVGVCLFNCFVSSIASHILDFLKTHKEVKCVFILVLFSFATGFTGICFLEELSLVDSLYLTVMSITTVGYGDVSFTSMVGRLFACGWLLVATIPWNLFLLVVQMMITKFIKYVFRRIRRFLRIRRIRRKMTREYSLLAEKDREQIIGKYYHALNKLEDLDRLTDEEVIEWAANLDLQEHDIPRDLESGL